MINRTSVASALITLALAAAVFAPRTEARPIAQPDVATVEAPPVRDVITAAIPHAQGYKADRAAKANGAALDTVPMFGSWEAKTNARGEITFTLRLSLVSAVALQAAGDSSSALPSEIVLTVLPNPPSNRSSTDTLRTLVSYRGRSANVISTRLPSLTPVRY